MLIELIQEALGSERHTSHTTSIKTEMSHTDTDAISVIIVPDEFKSDIENLKAHIGVRHWKSGLQITLSLQELLQICPRERKRSDAYGKLIKYLADEWKISLTIKKRMNNETQNSF